MRGWLIRNRIWVRWIAAAVVLCLLLAAGYWLFWINRFSLEIHLEGKEAMTVEYGEHYREPGAVAKLHGTKIFRDGLTLSHLEVQREGSVRENILGESTLHYHCHFLKWQGRAERVVSVEDHQAPTITLNPDPEGSLESGRIYKEAGFRAWDNYDGDLTESVIRKESLGLITYTVTDSAGNTATARRQVPEHDPVPPEILLAGREKYDIPVGGIFTEPGFFASDNYDGDLTDRVAVEGEIDRFTPGVYPIRYIVSDDYGNVTVVQREIRIYAAERPKEMLPQEKTIYLTFDDGPGPYTIRLLDILDQYDVKATFFVMDTEHYEEMAQIVSRGHSIGIHSVTHDYEEIYADREAYFNDLLTMQQIIYEKTGVLTHLMRFPGGSSNTVSRNIHPGIMTELEQLVQDGGFRFFDWNVDSNDAGGARYSREVFLNVIAGIMEQGTSVVLQHDIQSFSVEAVDDIIAWGLANGYTFKALTENSPGFHHGVQN